MPVPTLNATIQAADINGQTLLIQIWGTSAVNNLTLKADMPMAQMRYYFDEHEFWNSSFQFSEVALKFYINQASVYTLVDDIAAARDGQFYITIYKANKFYWGGIIIPESLTVDIDCPMPIVEIRVVDGIKSFANQNNHAPNKTFGEILHNCITNLPWAPQVYISEILEPMIFFGLQFTVTGATDIPYYDLSFTGKFDNDYEYLQAVLKEMGHYLVQAKGIWYIVPLFMVSSGSLSGTNIDYYNETINSTTLNFSLTNTKKSSGGIYYFTRAFGRVTTNFGTNDRSASSELSDGFSSPYPTFNNMTAWQSTTAIVRNVSYFINLQLFHNFQAGVFGIASVAVYITQKSGTEWWNGNKWVSTSAVAHSQLFGGEMYNQNVQSWSFSGVLPSVQGLFEISADFEAEDTNGGQIIKSSTTVALITEEAFSGSSTLGSLNPEFIYNTESGNTNVLNLNLINSLSLGSVAGKVFNYAPYTNKEMWDLRLHLLKDFLATPKRMMECDTDNLTTPVQFYQVGEWKIIPLRMDFDLLREEGSILGWAIQKI